MTKSEARKIVRDNKLDMMRALWIAEWQIDVSYGSLDPDGHDGDFTTLMCVTVRPRYQKAIMRINPEPFANEADFIVSLRHELIHVLTSPFWSYDEDVRQMMPPLDSMPLRALNQFYHDRWEALVLNVERMLDHGLGQTAKRMVATSRRRWGEDT